MSEEKSERQKAEALYDQYTAKFREFFEAGEKRSREAMESAMQKSRDYFEAMGQMSADQGKLFGEYLKRDLDQTARDMRVLGEEAREHLHPARLSAGALAATADALKLAGNLLLDLAGRGDQVLTYRAGEMTSAGTLTCLKCGKTQLLRQTTQIEPCPACSGAEFRKSY